MKVFLNGEERDNEINPMALKFMEKYTEDIEKALQMKVTEELDKTVISWIRGGDYVPRD